MRRPCRASGCPSPAASSLAAHCSPHRSTLRRHGAVNQRAVTKAHLWPYLNRVQKHICKNPESIAWVILDERWRVLVDHAREVLAKFASGRGGVHWEELAAQEVVKLAGDVPARTVVEVTTAMVMMGEMEPGRFKSDNAFWL